MKKILLIATLATVAGGFLVSSVQAEAPPGLRPLEPVVCGGDQDLVIRGRYISGPGDGVVVQGNCDVRIVDSRIEVGGRGVWVTGNGDAEVVRSFVSGAGGGLFVSVNGDVECEESEVHGGARVAGNGDIEKGDCRFVPGAVAWQGTGERAADEEAMAVEIGEPGAGSGAVTVDLGYETVVVDGDWVGIRTDGVTVEVDGDWRVVVDSPYSAADTGRLIVELGGEDAGEELQLQMAGDVLFDFDSTAIRPDAARQLAKVAHVVRQRAAGRVAVVGHTDSIGAAAYNQQLSEQRAVAVMGWLSRHEGIPASMMVGRGSGAKQPIAYNTMPDGSDNPEGRARNRRVEIRFARAESPLAIAAAGAGVTVGPAGVRVGGAEGGVTVGAGGVRVGGPGGEVTVGAGGVRVAGAAAEPENADREPSGPAPEGDVCERLCRAWRGISEATAQCATVVLELRGHPVATEILCVGAETPDHCRLCAAKLNVTEADCAAVLDSCF